MVQTGMVRKIDLLGRIVIPKEIRRSLKINSGDDIEMYIENDAIVLKKYHMLDNYFSLAKGYCRTIYENIHTHCIICSKDKVVASTQEVGEVQISEKLAQIIGEGSSRLLSENQTVPLFDKISEPKYVSQYISAINSMGEIYGSIVIYSTKKALSEQECNFVDIGAVYLCGHVI
ncbi:MAG: AbrB/MazE/SpoVT family DNA-binding domain-containing protein [Clostridiales bacterium]|jgi:AbrB family transcriptional regulator (stage V sporulation protein T)|nr:AbrB/MazE/SpoVT family DNA-binding domain-containing protein [Clostridiales bacterium]